MNKPKRDPFNPKNFNSVLKPKFGEWYPIESVPRDNTDILAITQDNFIFIEYFNKSDPVNDFYTHWTPLPKPPKRKSKNV